MPDEPKGLFRKQDLDAWQAAGGSVREELEDEGMALVVAERKADPANHQWKSLDEFKRERGLLPAAATAPPPSPR